MGIFIGEEDVVEIAVHYYEESGKVVVFDDPTENTKTVKVVFKRPDFSTSQRLMSASTVSDQSGNQTVNMMMLQNNMMYFLAKSWDVKAPDLVVPSAKADDGADIPSKTVPGKPIELNAENIGKLRVEIARALVNKLIPAIGQFI
jgi:hypothetical protein